MLGVAVAAALGGGGLIVARMNSGGAPATALTAGGAALAAAVAPPVSAPAGPSAADLAAADRAKQVEQLDAALRKLAGGTPDFSVAVLDRRTGQSYHYRGKVRFDTASIVKVQILTCMLLRAQDAGRRPTSAEMALAKPMIRRSDNDATTRLYNRLGGRTAVTRCNKRLGLTGTVVNSRWGLTRTTAADQVRLLAELADTRGPLSASSRKTAFTLMNTVDKAQDWGVPAVARKGEIFTVKNGWDTRSADGGLWAVNTIGRITAKNGAVDVSVAVLSHNNRTMAAGVTLVEKIAKLTRTHLRY
ncbi:serine hydrolase [Actinoplanes sp. NEAU-H7]|uniref:Serine hydrolase n=2 Tax=Actinoplanes flavus TaxID=2820290 RepID=A0ABS3UKR7_9ACTN|nr:serine hydrolase [Actinoplanes flavus]